MQRDDHCHCIYSGRTVLLKTMCRMHCTCIASTLQPFSSNCCSKRQQQGGLSFFEALSCFDSVVWADVFLKERNFRVSLPSSTLCLALALSPTFISIFLFSSVPEKGSRDHFRHLFVLAFISRSPKQNRAVTHEFNFACKSPSASNSLCLVSA